MLSLIKALKEGELALEMLAMLKDKNGKKDDAAYFREAKATLQALRIMRQAAGESRG